MSTSECNMRTIESSRLFKSKAGHLSDLRKKQKSVEELLGEKVDTDVLKQKFFDYEESFKKFMSVHEQYIESEGDANKRSQAIGTYDIEKDKKLNLQIAVDKYCRKTPKDVIKSLRSGSTANRTRASSRSSVSSLKKVTAARLKLEALKEKQQLVRTQAEISQRIELLEAQTELKIAEECAVIEEGGQLLGSQGDPVENVLGDRGNVCLVNRDYGNLSPPRVSHSPEVIHRKDNRDLFRGFEFDAGCHTSHPLRSSCVNPISPSGQHFNLSSHDQHVDPVISHRSVIPFTPFGQEPNHDVQVGVTPGRADHIHSISKSNVTMHTAPVMFTGLVQSSGHTHETVHPWDPPTQFLHDNVMTSGAPALPLGNQRGLQLGHPQNQVDHLQVIADAIRQGPTLPKVELLKFDGNPRDYIEFTTNFRNNIESQVTGDSHRLTRLISQCTGKAKEAIRSCINLPLTEGYSEAQRILHDNFGQPHMVAEAHISRLKELKLKTVDAPSLMSFARTLEDVWRALCSMGHLYSNRVDNQETLRMLMRKLPTESLKMKWTDRAGSLIIERGFVKYSDFIEFIRRIGTRLNNVFGEELKSSYLFKNRDKESLSTSNQRVNKITTLANSTSQEKSRKKFPPCAKCKGTHGIWKCVMFQDQSHDSKVNDVRSLKLCWLCLGEGHFSKGCTRGFKCKIKGCGGDHHTLIHPPKRVQERQSENVSSNLSKTDENVQEDVTEAAEGSLVSCNQNSTESRNQERTRVCFKVVPVKVRDPRSQKEIKTYAFLDSGSDATLCLQDVPEKLSLTGEPKKFTMETTTGIKSFSSNEIHIQLAPLNSQEWVDCRKVITTDRIPVESRHFATSSDLKRWPHLQDIVLPEIIEKDVTLLIGNDHPELVEAKLDQRCGGTGEPMAVKTPLGWTVCGPMPDKCPPNTVLAINANTEEERGLNLQIQDMYNTEFGGCLSDDVTCLSREDKRAEQIMKSSICLVDGHYNVDLPFRRESKDFPDSLPVAKKRLQYLKKKFDRDATFKSQYSTVMQKYEDEGSARRLSQEEIQRLQPLWFIPHHAVWHPRKPGEPRIVLDCASKANGVSLNDMLLKGPENTSSLVGVLLRFRIKEIGVAADIKRMFHQVHVTPKDRGALCYLWWPGGNTENEPVTYSMNVHVFGATSSPSVCGFALRQVAQDFGAEFSQDAVEAINNNFYVDDLLISFDDDSSATTTIEELCTLLNKAGFKLTKFLSSSRDVLKAIPEEELTPVFKNLEVSKDRLPAERALGVYWDVEKDTLNLAIKDKEYSPTRRGVLSSISSVYDPLGFAGPLVLPGREINQELCRLSYGWDDMLPNDILKRWEVWRQELVNLNGFGPNRCLRPKEFKDAERVELHHFSDASECHGYGTVSYLRYISKTGGVFCSFLYGKSRVKPLRGGVSVPKLELTAATVSVSVHRMLLKEIGEMVRISKVVFWTDSIIVLKYLRNENKRFTTFVANRIAKIKEVSEVSQWKHVRSENNVADLASRGMRASEKEKLHDWMNGPAFLWSDEEEWPSQPEELQEELKEGDEGVKKEVGADTIAVNMVNTDCSLWSALLGKYSCWSKLRRTVAWVMRAVTMFKGALRKNGGESLSAEGVLKVSELLRAEEIVVKVVQRESFETKEFTADKKKKGRLAKLKPMVEDGILRVGGRLHNSTLPHETKHPMIMPSNHHVTELLIMHYHKRSSHSGSQHVLASVRHRFWVISGLSSVRRVLRKCQVCRRASGSIGEQQMAPLPVIRVSSDSHQLVYPFSAVGIDLFGPLHTCKERVTRSSKNAPVNKRYGCIFTCLRYRAVHLELVKDLSTESFINAVIRFISRRGAPRVIFSDNGTNFKGAEKDILHALKAWDVNKIEKFFTNNLISWNFNPPASSHQGGVWERLIRSIRRVLHALIGQNIVDDETLETFLCEAEKVMNDRPITRSSEDPQDSAALTPNHIILMRHNISTSPTELCEDDKYRTRWKHVHLLANQFWKRWVKEYLPTLQERQKWLGEKANFKVGDLVLLVEKNVPRGHWPKGIIEQTYPDGNNLVRRADVRTSAGLYSRDIRKICMLEEDLLKLFENRN